MGKSRQGAPANPRRQRHVKLLESMIAGSTPPTGPQPISDGGLEALVRVLRQHPDLKITLSLEGPCGGPVRRWSVL